MSAALVLLAALSCILYLALLRRDLATRRWAAAVAAIIGLWVFAFGSLRIKGFPARYGLWALIAGTLLSVALTRGRPIHLTYWSPDLESDDPAANRRSSRLQWRFLVFFLIALTPVIVAVARSDHYG